MAAKTRPTEFCTTIAPPNISRLCPKARGTALRYGSAVNSWTKLASPTNSSWLVPRQEYIEYVTAVTIGYSTNTANMIAAGAMNMSATRVGSAADRVGRWRCAAGTEAVCGEVAVTGPGCTVRPG